MHGLALVMGSVASHKVATAHLAKANSLVSVITASPLKLNKLMGIARALGIKGGLLHPCTTRFGTQGDCVQSLQNLRAAFEVFARSPECIVLMSSKTAEVSSKLPGASTSRVGVGARCGNSCMDLCWLVYSCGSQEALATMNDSAFWELNEIMVELLMPFTEV